MASPPSRLLVYSHDTYGLGHLRRCLQIATGLSTLTPAPSVLVATGSPRAQSFALPQGCDTLTLPAVTKSADGGYVSRSLDIAFEDLVELRSELLDAAGRAFAPDAVLVDHAPAGMGGELRRLLARMATSPRRPRLVLGLRDVIDDAAVVRADWDRNGIWELIDRVYDAVLVYGDGSVLTTAEELGLVQRFPDKVRFVGYLAAGPSRARPDEPPMVLVTTGGGGDGAALLRAYATFLDHLAAPTSFSSVIVAGPLLARRRRDEIERRFAAVGHRVEVVTFTDRMDELLARASAVVSMAGYNTVVEILASGVPALLVPRERPRREQTLRAERLDGVGGITVARGCDAIAAISDFVPRALVAPRRAATTVDMGGVAATVGELAGLLTPSDGQEARVARFG